MKLLALCFVAAASAATAPVAIKSSASFDAVHIPHSRDCGITGRKCHVLPNSTTTIPAAPAHISTCTHMTCTAKLHQCTRHNLNGALWAPERTGSNEHDNAVCQWKMVAPVSGAAWHSASGKAERKAAHLECVKDTAAGVAHQYNFDGEECGGSEQHWSIQVNHDKSESHCTRHHCFITGTAGNKQCVCHAVDAQGKAVPVDCVQTKSIGQCVTGRTIAHTGQKCGTGKRRVTFNTPTQLPYAGGAQCGTDYDIPCDTGVSCDVDCVEQQSVGECVTGQTIARTGQKCGSGTERVTFTTLTPSNGNGRQCSSAFSRPCNSGHSCDVHCEETRHVGQCVTDMRSLDGRYCGSGTQRVFFHVQTPHNGNGRPCSTGPLSEACNTGVSCDIDCLEFRNVGSCEGACGRGTRQVTFTVHTLPQANGRQCSSPYSEGCDTGRVCRNWKTFKCGQTNHEGRFTVSGSAGGNSAGRNFASFAGIRFRFVTTWRYQSPVWFVGDRIRIDKGVYADSWTHRADLSKCVSPNVDESCEWTATGASNGFTVGVGFENMVGCVQCDGCY